MVAAGLADHAHAAGEAQQKAGGGGLVDMGCDGAVGFARDDQVDDLLFIVIEGGGHPVGDFGIEQGQFGSAADDDAAVSAFLFAGVPGVVHQQPQQTVAAAGFAVQKCGQLSLTTGAMMVESGNKHAALVLERLVDAAGGEAHGRGQIRDRGAVIALLCKDFQSLVEGSACVELTRAASLFSDWECCIDIHIAYLGNVRFQIKLFLQRSNFCVEVAKAKICRAKVRSALEIRESAMQPHRVVVVGGGFAGLQLINDLKGAPVEVTLIDRRNHHLFQPLLYQVATSVLATSEIAWPIRGLYRNRPEVTTLLAEATGVDRAAKTVSLKHGEAIPYDTLVLATGARHAYFGHDEWEADAPGLKTLEDATTIRRRILLAFEQAELERDPVIRQALLTFTVIGGGPTGVEMTGIIAELAHTTLPKEFRNIDTRTAKIVLVEAGPRILPVFTPELSGYATSALEKLGVEVRTGQAVTDCNALGVTIGETFMPSRTVIWAAGVQASPAAQWLGAPADRAGRTQVLKDLTMPGDPNIFVVGDTASVARDDGSPVPGVAPAAKQQGAYVARVIIARLKGKLLDQPFHYKHQGNLATIGKHAAVCDFGRVKLTGSIAWWVWGLAHIYFLIGTRSRFQVAISWLWIFVSGQHSARLITQKETLKDEVG